MENIINPHYFGLLGCSILVNLIAFLCLFVGNEDMKIIAAVIIIRTCHEIATNILIAKLSLDYFNIDYKYHSVGTNRQLLYTQNPYITGLVWGIISTWEISLLIGFYISMICKIPFSHNIVYFSDIKFYLINGTMILLIICHQITMCILHKAESNLYNRYISCFVLQNVSYIGLFIGTILLSLIIVIKRLFPYLL